MFKNINKERTVKKALQNLRQQGTITAYVTEF
jgi:hypothetical protein